MFEFEGRQIPNELKEIVDPKQTILLVWDMQNDQAGGSFNKEALIRNASPLIASAAKAAVKTVYTRQTPFLWKDEAVTWIRRALRDQKVDHPSKLKARRLHGSIGWNIMEPFKQSAITFNGHAIECRITAESPQHGFRPCPGLISNWQGPTGPGIRLDTHCYSGYFVPPYYDSLLAKLIVHGKNRQESADATNRALEHFHVEGIDTLIPFLQVVIADDDYRAGKVNTRWLEKKLEEYSATITG